MKAQFIAVLLCLAVSLLLVGVCLAAEPNPHENLAEPTIGKPTAQGLSNGPKEIPPGWEKIIFIHYKKPRGKPADKPGRKPPKSDSQCYTFLAKGVKWKEPGLSGFLVDAANIEGLSESEVLAAVGAAADAWRAVPIGVDLLPSCEPESNLSADWDNPDGYNEVVFGDVPYANAIAVAIVWGIFGGPPGLREIVEFDMIFDDVDFDWSIGGSETTMDLQNIATHELGHAVGLGDLYESGCAEVTMYGYSENGETKKQTLESDDIAGLVALYGE